MGPNMPTSSYSGGIDRDIAVIGAGPAGLACAYTLQEKGVVPVVLEKDATYAGLCGSFERDGYTFDKFIHAAFSKETWVNRIFAEATDFETHNNFAITNYWSRHWVTHPIITNLAPLPFSVKSRCILDFIKRGRRPRSDDHNYEQWLRAQYGDYYVDNFPLKYTRKYWTVEAAELEDKWVGSRLYNPSLKEVMVGALSRNPPQKHYFNEVRYPVRGGFQSFFSHLAQSVDILYDHTIVRLDARSRKITFDTGETAQYETIFSSMPLPELCKATPDLPREITSACDRLSATSGVIVSLGLKSSPRFSGLYFYIYDEDILPARVYSPSRLSSSTTPDNRHSLQAEIYFSPKKLRRDSFETLLEHTIAKLDAMDVIDKRDVDFTDVRPIPYANVIFTPEIYEAREAVIGFYRKNNIIPMGRFGEWDYFWSDQSLLSGRNNALSWLRSREAAQGGKE